MGSFTASASTTYFCPLMGQLDYATTTTEVNSQTLIRSNWQLLRLFVRWDTSSLSAASTVRTRVNSGNGNLNVSIPANASGTVTDSTNSDSLSSGDTGGYTFIMGAGAAATATMRIVAVLAEDFGGFTAASTQKFIGEGAPDTTIANGLVRSSAISGWARLAGTETIAQWTARIALTSTNLKTHISANSLTASSTLRFRIGGANGSQNVSISNGATGNFEDTTNSDAVAVGNLINYQLTTGGTSAASLTVNNIQALYADRGFQVGFQMVTGANIAPPITGVRYDPVQGTQNNTDETSSQFSGLAGQIKNLFIIYLTNTISSAGTWVSRKNGANGNLSVSISNGATGYFEDTTNIDTIASTDTIDRALSNAATSTGSIATNTRGSIFIPAYNPSPTEAVNVSDYEKFRTSKPLREICDTPNERLAKRPAKIFLNIVRIADSATATLISGIKQIIVTDTLRVVDYTRRTVTKQLREVLRITESLLAINKIHFIQTKTASGSGTAMTITLPNTPIKGNGLILTIGIDSALLQSVSGITSAGATWKQAVASINGVVDNEIWYASDLQSSPGAVITVNFTGITLEAHATVREYRGLEDVNMLDRVIDNSGSSASPDTGTTATTTVANELWVGSTTTLSATNQSSPTSNFILIDGVTGTLISNAYLEKFAGVLGQAHSSTTADNVAWAGVMATFKAPSIFEIVVTEILRIAELFYTKPKAILRLTDQTPIRDFTNRTLTKVFRDVLRVRERVTKNTTKVLSEVLRINDYERLKPKAILRLADPVRIVDYLSNRTLSKRFTDPIRVKDTATKTVTKILTDIVRIVDRATATLISVVKQIIVTDSLVLVDYIRRTVTKPLIEPLRVRDYLANRTFTKVLTQVVRINDYMKTTPKTIVRIFEPIRINDSVIKRVTKRFTDVVRISDYLGERILTLIITEVLRIKDSAVKRTSKGLSEIVRVNDYLSRRNLVKMFTETMRVVDRTAKTVTKPLTEVVRIRERITEILAHHFTVLATDVLRITDSTAKTVTKALTDIVRIVDRATQFRSKVLMFTESLRINERVSRTTTKILQEILRIVEVVAVSIPFHTFTIILREGVNVVDVRIGSIVVLIHQIITVAQAAVQSIGEALEQLLHPKEAKADSVAQ